MFSFFSSKRQTTDIESQHLLSNNPDDCINIISKAKSAAEAASYRKMIVLAAGLTLGSATATAISLYYFIRGLQFTLPLASQWNNDPTPPAYPDKTCYQRHHPESIDYWCEKDGYDGDGMGICKEILDKYCPEYFKLFSSGSATGASAITFLASLALLVKAFRRSVDFNQSTITEILDKDDLIKVTKACTHANIFISSDTKVHEITEAFLTLRTGSVQRPTLMAKG